MEKEKLSSIQNLSISYECALAIGNSLNLSEMLHNVIHTIVHKTNAHRGSIWLRGEKERENIKLGARAGSLLTKTEIKKRVGSFQDIFEKIWKNQQPVIKNRDDKDFFQYCFKITGKEQSILIVPVKNVAIIKLVYTNKEIVNETLANMLLSLSEKLSIAIEACMAHTSIKKEIQIRKETEQDLLYSEKKYRTLIETMEEGIGIVDENENFTFINQATANIFRYSKKELLGKNLKELTTPEEFQRIRQQTSIRKTGESSKYELSIFRKDGEQRILSVTATPKFDDNGKYKGSFGIFRDITEHKQAEDALRKSEEQFRLITENTNDLIALTTFDLKATFTYVSPSIKAISGYEPKELLGKSCLEFINPEDKKKLFPLLKKYVNLKIKKLITGKESTLTEKIEFRIKDKSGNWRYAQSTANVMGNQLLFVTRDITEQKQAEAELKKKSDQLISHQKELERLYGESEVSRKSLLSILEDVAEKERDLRESQERFQNIVANTGDWIWETDEKGCYTYSSPIVKQVLGYEYKEMLGKHFYDFFIPEGRERLKKAAFEVFKKKTKFKNFINKNLHKNGHTVVLETSGVPMLDDKGNLLGYRGVDRDISERKRAEQTQSVLYNIADAVNTTKDLDELFKIIHKQLSTIIDTTNYYVALYDKETDTISLPYDVNQKDKFTAFPAGKTLTAYVIKTGKPLLANEEVSEKLTQAGEVELVGTPSKIWLGVPLKIENEVMGVVTVQSYTDASLYTKKDLEILEFVSGQIALAIARKQAEKALLESEEKLKNIVEKSTNLFYSHTTEHVITYLSPQVKVILGYTPKEAMVRWTELASDNPINEKGFELTVKAIETSKPQPPYELELVHKNGKKVWVEVREAPVVINGKTISIVGALTDITERKRAEQTQSVLYNIADAVNTTKDLDELFESIQSYLSTILDTTNFFIALYDKETDTISLPYHVDKKDRFTSFPAGKTLTGYVIKTGKPLLANEEVSEKLAQAGEVELVGTPSKIWLGVPLKIENEVTGVVAVQSYTDASLYREKDLAILEFVSDSIAIAIAHMRADNALENSEEKYRLLFEETPVGILTCDINGIIQSVNNTALQILGSPSEEATKQINLLTFPPLKEIGFSDDLKHCMNEGREISSEKLYTSKWGKSVFFHYKIVPTLNQEGKITGALCALEDITEKKQAEKLQSTIYKISDAINTTANLDELYQTIHQHLSTVVDTTNFYIALYDEDKELISFPCFVDEKDSQPAPRKLRKGLTEYVMRTSKAIFVTEDSLYKLEERGEVELIGSSSALWLGIPLKIEKKIIGVIAVQSYTDPSLYNEKDLEILEFASDQIAIAIERKQAEEALQRSEDQLRQAQKMEAIGRLAGGIAHDFNNLLLAINGRCDLLLKKLDKNDPISKEIALVRKSGERAASLTKQLLAFSRKQVIQPKVINLNEITSEIKKMIQTLIGEDIILQIILNPDLGYIKIDKGQIEQILMNLSVNARDAMPGGGKLTFEIANVDIDKKYAFEHIEIKPGPYVMLAISDTGCGMDEETKSHIFEPFFTTKEVGKGTGLGLSTVYGIVKQNNGGMFVYSEPGMGTVFKIYFPRIEAEKKVKAKKLSKQITKAIGGAETILLVEDEEAVRDLVYEILEENGYNVLAAQAPDKAILICKQYKETIDLMLTDVVMPEMSGKVLSEKLKIIKPDMKVLFMSGYTDNEIVDRGILEPGTKFIQKPFTPDSLIGMIREVLDESSNKKN